MKKIQETKPIWHAMIWIIIYVVIVNIGGGISESIGIVNLAESLLLIFLSIAMLIYLKKNNWLKMYGVKQLNKVNYKKTLFYIPLILFVFILYIKGVNQELSTLDFVITCILMLSVGFIEELLFRGFLFQAILKKSVLNKATIISGVTFGLGHIVNLARGYSMEDQIIQIVGAIVIGIVLTYCFAISKNIIPGMIFHTLFNISGSITYNNLKLETYILITIIVIGIIYSLYLSKELNREEK